MVVDLGQIYPVTAKFCPLRWDKNFRDTHLKEG